MRAHGRSFNERKEDNRSKYSLLFCLQLCTSTLHLFFYSNTFKWLFFIRHIRHINLMNILIMFFELFVNIFNVNICHEVLTLLCAEEKEKTVQHIEYYTCRVGKRLNLFLLLKSSFIVSNVFFNLKSSIKLFIINNSWISTIC